MRSWERWGWQMKRRERKPSHLRKRSISHLIGLRQTDLLKGEALQILSCQRKSIQSWSLNRYLSHPWKLSWCLLKVYTPNLPYLQARSAKLESKEKNCKMSQLTLTLLARIKLRPQAGKSRFMPLLTRSKTWTSILILALDAKRKHQMRAVTLVEVRTQRVDQDSSSEHLSL